MAFVSTVAFAVLSLANMMIIARSLGPEGRGAVSLLVSIVGLTAMACCLGVHESNANLGCRNPETRAVLAVNSLVLATVFGAIGVAAVLVLRHVLPRTTADIPVGVVLVALVGIPLAILMYYLSVLVRAAGAMRVANVALVLPAVVAVCGNAVLALTGHVSVPTALVTWLAAQALGDAVLFLYIWSHDGPARPHLGLARIAVAFGLRAQLGAVMISATYRLDQWVLGAFTGTTALGYYAVAVSWSEVLFYLPTALALVMRPHFVRATREEAAVRAASVFRIGLLVTVPIAAGTILLAPVLCAGVFGQEFAPAEPLLQVVALGGFGIVAFKVLGNALIAQGNPLRESASIGVAFVLTVVLDFVLIPKYGAMGAAVASAVAYLIGGLTMCMFFARVFALRWRSLMPRPSDVKLLASRLNAWRSVDVRP